VRSDSAEAARVSREVATTSSTRFIVVTDVSNKADSICLPFKVRNTKGAQTFSASQGTTLVHCTGADGKTDKGIVHCTADLLCANNSRCDMKMTCASTLS